MKRHNEWKEKPLLIYVYFVHFIKMTHKNCILSERIYNSPLFVLFDVLAALTLNEM